MYHDFDPVLPLTSLRSDSIKCFVICNIKARKLDMPHHICIITSNSTISILTIFRKSGRQICRQIDCTVGRKLTVLYARIEMALSIFFFFFIFNYIILTISDIYPPLLIST